MHWYLVANQREVRVFVKTFGRPELRVLKTLTNPLGREKRRNLIRKQAGRGVKSIGNLGAVHYSEPKRRDPIEEAKKQFAKDISRFLEGEKSKHSFESLEIVAEPHFLGKIRAEMSAELKNSVTQWKKKDLQKTPIKKIVHFLLPEKKTSNDLKAPR